MPPGRSTQRCPNTKGSIVARVNRTDKSVKKQTANKPLKGVEIKIDPLGKKDTTGGAGSVQFKKLDPGPVTITAKLTTKQAEEFSLESVSLPATVTGEEVVVRFRAHRLARLKVRCKEGATMVAGVKVKLTGVKDLEATSAGPEGLADFGKLPLGDYQATVEYTEGDANDQRYYVPEAVDINVARGDNKIVSIKLPLKVPMAVKVFCGTTMIENVKVKIAALGKTLEATTGNDGFARFAAVVPVEHTVDFELQGDAANIFQAPAQVRMRPRKTGPNELLQEVLRQEIEAHVKVALELPDATKRALPPAVAFRLKGSDASTLDAKLDDAGKIVKSDDSQLKLAKGVTYTLEVPAAANKYVVFEKPGTPALAELVEDAAPDFDTPLGTAIAAGKRAILLPQADVKIQQIEHVVAPADNWIADTWRLDPKNAAVGTATAPVEMLFKPKWQYVRFEYFDVKYGAASHGGKRIGVPPLLVKAKRSSPDGALGTPDAAACFPVNPLNAATSSLAIPWLVTRKDTDGTALPKLDKNVLFEFGREKAWIEATSATARAIVKLDPAADPDKAKIGQVAGRAKYYDLPKKWSSRNQWTRLSGTTAKFFDELLDTDLEGAYDKAKPLTFSLDDVVLVGAGAQSAVKDKDETDADVDIDAHSRIAILHLDPADGFKVKVHDPRAEEVFWSKTLFQKEAGADVYRNVITALPSGARAIVFCNGFHDVFDKRAEAADFTKKEILGVRVAKLDDPDLSAKKKFDQAADVTAGYVHREREFELHYLHCAATDDTTVYSAMVTHWSARVFAKVADAPGYWDLVDEPLTDDANDEAEYRSVALKNSMERWNAKDYQFEQQDGGTAQVVKTFHLFEGKDVEAPAGTMNKRGGKAHCLIGVGPVDCRSCATATWMWMEKGGGSEADVWGRENDYDGTLSPVSLVFAHELGHGAIGLWDDYVTQDLDGVPTYNNLDSGGSQVPQRYPGVPFERDRTSMMKVNEALRARMAWGRAKWLNDMGADNAKPLHKFTAGKKFKVTYAPAGKTKLGYYLEGASNIFYKPTHQGAAVALGEQGVADLHLYRLGDDEFAQTLKGGPYDGILVVEQRIAVAFHDGLDPKPAAWVTGTRYVKGACVANADKYYLCRADHTAGATFAGDAASWFEVSPSSDQWNRVAGTTFDPGEWVSEGNTWAMTVVQHESGSFIPANFLQGGPNKGEWQKRTPYVRGDFVRRSGSGYFCITDHTSTGSRTADGANWVTMGTDQGAFAAGLNLGVGDLCRHGGATYVCLTAHVAGSRDADVAAGRLIATATQPMKWTDDRKSDWFTKLHQKLVTAVESADGLFKIVGQDATKPFAKTYVRLFPQWATKAAPADADPANTQYVIECTNNKADGFETPSATTMKVDGKVSANTVARYLLGKLSNVKATRAGQNPTAALAKADLAALATWVENTAGQTTFTVEDIT